MKKKITLAAVTLYFLALCMQPIFAVETEIKKSVNELVLKLLPPLSENDPRPSVAIMSFTTENKSLTFEKYFQAELFEGFFGIGKMKIIERDNIDKILSEQNFQLSGNVDDSSAKSIGKVIGVDYVCYGTILDLDQNLRISGKMVTVQTGEIVSVASINLVKNEEINRLLNQNSRTNSDLKNETQNLKSFWKTEKNRNDFDGFTSYTFLLNSLGNYSLYLECQENDDPSKSIVYTGIQWDEISKWKGPDDFEIKGDDGKITKIMLYGGQLGKFANQRISFHGPVNTRQLVDLLLNNNKLIIRQKNDIKTFSSHGLPQAMKDMGLSYSLLNQALKNEEF